jgi:hypothetical protein
VNVWSGEGKCLWSFLSTSSRQSRCISMSCGWCPQWNSEVGGLSSAPEPHLPPESFQVIPRPFLYTKHNRSQNTPYSATFKGNSFLALCSLSGLQGPTRNFLSQSCSLPDTWTWEETWFQLTGKFRSKPYPRRAKGLQSVSNWMWFVPKGSCVGILDLLFAVWWDF